MSFRPLLLAVPVVLAAGLSLAGPAAAVNGPADQTELAQSPPTPPPAAGPDRRGPGADRPAFNPKAMCLDMVGRRAGNRTALKVRLELKPEQMSAWDAFAKVADDADSKEIARCNTLPTEMKERPNFLDRLTMEETVMKARADRLAAVKAPLTALYNVLTPDQKVVMDRPRPMMMGMRGPREWKR
jgi:hypothetical protein